MRLPLLALAIALALTAGADVHAQRAPVPQLRSLSASRVPTDSLRPRIAPDTFKTVRQRHTEIGAIAGAVTLGAVGAVLAVTQIGFGCDVTPGGCDEGRQRVRTGAFAFVVGAITGGLGGAVVGYAWPVQRAREQ